MPVKGPQAKLKLRERFASDARAAFKGMSRGKSKADPLQLTLEVMNEAFVSRLEVGLFKWRLGLGPPTKDLTSALQLVEEGYQILVGLCPRTEHWRLFDFAMPGIVGVLVPGSGRHFEAAVAPTSSWHKVAASELRLVRNALLDALVLTVLRGSPPPPKWRELIESLAAGKRLKLLRDTSKGYIEALLVQQDLEEFSQAIRALEELFRMRANDPYYSDGPGIYGGGPNNTEMVDVVLAAIIKTATSNNPTLARLDSIHRLS